MINKIVITLGDPAGIGPEVLAKALACPAVKRLEPIIVGDSRVIKRYLGKKSALHFFDVSAGDINKIRTGTASAASGRAAYDFIIQGLELMNKGGAKALVTGPVSKAAINLAGIPFIGHTELIARRSNAKNYAMMMAAGKLRAVMVTRHIPLEDVPGKISSKEIVKAASLSNDFLKRQFSIKKPRICVCALNPHAGEDGLLGSQEQKKIIPAVKMLKKMGINVFGPIAGDSAWVKIIDNKFDLLVCMYHDQAMTGLKSVLPNKIVNITLGLPFIRTSPGHGTGFDIAGKGIADPASMIEAILAAARLSHLV